MASKLPGPPVHIKIPGDTSGRWLNDLWQYIYQFTDGNRNDITTSAGVATSTTTVTNTTTETTVYTYTLQPNELHLHERLKVEISGVYSNASGSDDFTIRFKVNGTTQATVARTAGNVTNQGWRALYELTTRTLGTSGTFIDNAEYTDGTTVGVVGTTSTTTVDTTAEIIISITVQWANAKAGNTFSCTQSILRFDH